MISTNICWTILDCHHHPHIKNIVTKNLLWRLELWASLKKVLWWYAEQWSDSNIAELIDFLVLSIRKARFTIYNFLYKNMKFWNDLALFFDLTCLIIINWNQGNNNNLGFFLEHSRWLDQVQSWFRSFLFWKFFLYLEILYHHCIAKVFTLFGIINTSYIQNILFYIKNIFRLSFFL